MNSRQLFRRVFAGFMEDEALTRGAAISFYTVTSIGPVLFIVIGIAGLVYGQDAAQKAMVGQLAVVMGGEASEFLQAIVQGNSAPKGALATVIGILTLLVTITGVFGEMQTAMNKIWRIEPLPMSVSSLIRARAASAGLVAVLGFLMIVSLAVSAALTAFSIYLAIILPIGQLAIYAANTVVSFSLLAVLFAAIYKLLPDRPLKWRDVALGAVVTAALFTIGKTLISLYLGSSAIGSSYGATGALILLLLWVFYTVMIFLVGAEVTRAVAMEERGPISCVSP